MSRLTVLGCSGGIGGELRTTSLLIDDDILIDCGTGAADLSLDAMTRIRDVFITHSHLDHLAVLPMLIDSVGYRRGAPLTLHALPETLETLREHLFNWRLWPDFTHIPTVAEPYLRYATLTVGEPVTLGTRRITPLPARHVVPAVGYHVDSGRASLVFSGDTTSNDALWQHVNRIANLRHLIIETAFCDRDRAIAVASKHLCPSMLADELAKLERSAQVHIAHLKPGDAELTMQEIAERCAKYAPRMLQGGDVLEL